MSELPLIVFDVNETLLDLDTMTPIFARIFREKEAMRLWFANLILYSEALTLAKSYVPFTDIGAAVLQMLAATRGIPITAADEKELKDKFSTMPPHREVPAALGKLKTAGFRLFTLTDNLLEVQGRQLEHGGVIHEFVYADGAGISRASSSGAPCDVGFARCAPCHTGRLRACERCAVLHRG